MGLRFLVTRAHGKSPFFVAHGFEADMPCFLRELSSATPVKLAELTEAELDEYVDHVAARALDIASMV